MFLLSFIIRALAENERDMIFSLRLDWIFFHFFFYLVLDNLNTLEDCDSCPLFKSPETLRGRQ